VLLITLGLTLAAWHLILQASQQRAEQQFLHRAEQEQHTLLSRMQAYEQILRSAAALFASGKPVSRNDWQRYVASLKLKENLPGVEGVGYTVMVSPEQKAAHEESIRSEGFLQYAINPPGQREIYSSIIWLEPFSGRNLRAFGYDMYSEPTRREAMQRARDSGRMAMTGKLRLMQESKHDIQPGFLMYFPVYRTDQPHNDLQQRQFALQGFVFSPFRAHDLMRSIRSAAQ
jgi:CHASE1-domain containing sensor protein